MYVKDKVFSLSSWNIDNLPSLKVVIQGAISPEKQLFNPRQIEKSTYCSMKEVPAAKIHNVA